MHAGPLPGCWRPVAATTSSEVMNPERGKHAHSVLILHLKKGGTTMQRNAVKQTLRAKVCLLLLSGLLIFFSGCGNGYNNPGSPTTPQATPTKGY